MALYHLGARIIGRSAGKSVIASAAWQNACELFDKRLGRWSKFEGKRTISYSAVLLPTDTPALYRDRETLWNAVEAVEKRKDAQLARQIDVALPDELTVTSRIAVLERFAETITRAGFPVDVTLVEKSRDGIPARHHGYILMPTRQMTAGAFTHKDREWNNRNKLVELRSAWATILNAALAAEGYDTRVDHRSNKDRGIATEPAPHVGVIATNMARRGERPDRLRGDEQP